MRGFHAKSTNMRAHVWVEIKLRGREEGHNESHARNATQGNARQSNARQRNAHATVGSHWSTPKTSAWASDTRCGRLWLPSTSSGEPPIITCRARTRACTHMHDPAPQQNREQKRRKKPKCVPLLMPSKFVQNPLRSSLERETCKLQKQTGIFHDSPLERRDDRCRAHPRERRPFVPGAPWGAQAKPARPC